ncbi:unnamed protein product [Caenorhabditis sp. 36 PRJEB53466]|nr:unnamed protein product [Caenorhabditis sp. 36 PRJEB53466]
MKFSLGILFFCSSVASLDLNEIKRMKTDPTTIATTTTTVTTTTPTTTTTAPTTTTTTPTTTTTEAITFSIVDPGVMLIDCPTGCPTGWKYLNSKCYFKYDVAATYSEAQSACSAQSAQLATITSFDENDALRKAYDSNLLVDETKETWIGLELTSGAWKWTDGSAMSYSNWAPTQPASDQCVQMITDALSNSTYLYQRGGWKTYSCTQKRLSLGLEYLRA